MILDIRDFYLFLLTVFYMISKSGETNKLRCYHNQGQVMFTRRNTSW